MLLTSILANIYGKFPSVSIPNSLPQDSTTPAAKITVAPSLPLADFFLSARPTTTRNSTLTIVRMGSYFGKPLYRLQATLHPQPMPSTAVNMWWSPPVAARISNHVLAVSTSRSLFRRIRHTNPQTRSLPLKLWYADRRHFENYGQF